MINETEHLVLDVLKLKDIFGAVCEVGPENGLEISIKYDQGLAPIARVGYDESEQSCYVRTYKTNLQDCVVSWDLFTEFIKLVDEAYYRVPMAIQSEKLTKFLD